MGFDLYGTNGGNEKIDHDNPVEGQYFRANVWYWRPLWDLTCSIGKDILTDRDIEASLMMGTISVKQSLLSWLICSKI